MPQRFSEKLISDTIEYFKNRDLEITAEQAEEYLASFAKLYNCFENILAPKKAPIFSARQGGKSGLFSS